MMSYSSSSPSFSTYSSSQSSIRLLLFLTICSSVLSYSVLPGQMDSIRFLEPIYDRDYNEDPSITEYDSRIKRGLDEIEQFSKRTNLKRLVILSARGFGRK